MKFPSDGTSSRQLGKAGHSVATNSAEKQVHNFLLKKKATGTQVHQGNGKEYRRMSQRSYRGR